MSQAAEVAAYDAEDAVLGCLLSNPKVVERILPLLEPQHFARPSAADIYVACRSLYLAGKPSEPLVVLEELKRGGKQVSRERILELSAIVPASSSAPHYARLVVSAWQKRELVRTLTASLKEAANGHPAEQALANAEHSLLELRGKITKGRQAVIPAPELVASFNAKMANPVLEGAGVSTPFSFLKPLQNGRLYVLGGYQKDGKTVVATQFLKSAAKAGKRVGFASVEMGWEDLRDRIVSSFGIPYHEAQSGRVTDKRLAEQALSEISEWQVDVIDDEAISASGLRRYQKLGRYEFLVIDHLHRFDWAERRDLERIVREITNLSRSEQIPVLLLAQLHRRQDEFPRPTMSSLRESGMIEAEASMVAFIWRHRDDNKLPTEEAELIVAANRYGKVSAYPLYFAADKVHFTEVQR